MTVNMVPCPKCGTPQSPDVRRCRACGQQLGVAPTADEPLKQLGKTQVSGTPASSGPSKPPLASTASLEPPAGTPTGSPGFKKTMMGMPALSPPSTAAPSAPAPAAGSLHKTMLGVAPMAGSPLGSAAPARPRTVAGLGGPALPEPSVPNTSSGIKKTMLGVAPPSVPPPASETPGAPHHSAPLAATQVQFNPSTAAAQPSGFNPSGTLPLQGDQGASQGPSHPSQPPPPVHPSGSSGHQKTMLGVAVPGIAPMHPGQAKPTPAAPQVYAAPPVYSVPPSAAAPASVEQAPRSRRLIYGLFVTLFLGLVLASVFAFYWLSSPYSVAAKVVLDDNGDEQLEVSCSDCPDGTTSEIDGQMTTFKQGKARVTLSDPLKVGNNSLSISLLKPGDKHAETLELTVPVQFRVRGDLSGLGEDPPTLRVAIQAIPGTRVVLDGNAIALDAGGRGDYKVDVSKELTGEAVSLEKLEKTIPYTITPPDADPAKGEITMRANIAPLKLDAPGPSIVIDKPNFMLAGRTQKGGSVSVAGRAITVDPAGRFAQLMSVSSAGETTISVRGSAKDFAPRLVPVKIRRVESLADEAKRLKGVSRTAFADVASNADNSKGSSVLVDARVVESRTDSHTTVILADVTSGCSSDSCLMRVVYGAKMTLKKDEIITVSGTVAGTVDGPRTGTRIVELQADLIVKGA